MVARTRTGEGVVVPTRRRRTWRELMLSGLGVRIIVAQTLVILVAIGTIWLVDTTLGPRLFHDELVEGGHVEATESENTFRAAFQTANSIAGVIALLVALVVALLVTVLIARRLDRLVRGVTRAATTIATGDYAARVPTPRLGAEVDTLVDAFNGMASALQDVESTRSRLLGDLAHELRTPIATLDAYLEAAEDGVAEFDERTFALLRGQTHRLARLADDIGAVSRAEERLGLELGPVWLGDIVNTTVGAAAPFAAEAGVGLHRRIDPGIPLVLGDVTRLEQVLTNLIDNALRHTPRGGTVTVHASSGPGRVRVEVRDTGNGIDPDDLTHITERFFRGRSSAENRSEGSGVGLTIAEAIVRGHHGEMEVWSAGPGQGAEVSWWLPTR